MPAVYEHPIVVADQDIDGWGHANNISWLKWLMEAATSHSAAQGWPGGRYAELGVGWVVRSHHLDYHRQAFRGESLVVKTWVATMTKVTSTRQYRVVRPADDALLMEARTEWAFVSRETGRPTRIPMEVASAFELVPE